MAAVDVLRLGDVFNGCLTRPFTRRLRKSRIVVVVGRILNGDLARSPDRRPRKRSIIIVVRCILLGGLARCFRRRWGLLLIVVAMNRPGLFARTLWLLLEVLVVFFHVGSSCFGSGCVGRCWLSIVEVALWQFDLMALLYDGL